jgi:hypothetical protein
MHRATEPHGLPTMADMGSSCRGHPSDDWMAAFVMAAIPIFASNAISRRCKSSLRGSRGHWCRCRASLSETTIDGRRNELTDPKS